MFQPSGPNFLLSKMIALKKHRPQRSLLKATGFVLVSKSLSVMALYDFMMFYWRPFGGSEVILIPF